MRAQATLWVKRGLRGAFAALPPKSTSIRSEHWGLVRQGDGSLTLAGLSLPELGRRHGTPLHVVHVERLRENARRFLQAPGATPVRHEVFFSYKTNPVPGVLHVLHEAGVGAEVISHYELWLALRMGVPPNKIVYNGPAKSEASIRLALQRDIALLNLNHRAELPLVARIAKELGVRPRIGIRVTFGGWAAQFGTAAHGGAALRLFEEALATPQLDVVGLHVHRGGMLRSEAELLAHVEAVLAFSDELKTKLGLSLRLLDLGGSLASPSVRGLSEREVRLNRSFFRELEAPEPEHSLSIERYLQLLLERVEEHHRSRGDDPPRVLLEPGRALTSDAQLLLTQVLGIKTDGERTFAILDAGINLAESCRSEFHQLLHTSPRSEASPGIYTLVGPICTPGDTLRWAVQLPELAPGDILAIMDAGAYFVPFSTSFSFPRAGIVGVASGHVTEMRRAETFDDLIQGDLWGVPRINENAGP